MGMTNKQALKRGFHFKYTNPFICKADFVGVTIIIMLLLFSVIGFYTHTKFFLGLSIILGLAQAFVSLTNFLTSERIKELNSQIKPTK